MVVSPSRVRAFLLDAEWRAYPLLLETLRESLLTRPKMPSRTVLKVDVLVKRAAAQSARRDPDVFFDQKKGRMAFLDLFRRLQGAGRGRLIVGRRGHPTRFELRDSHVRLEIEALLQEMGITASKHGPTVNAPGFDDRAPLPYPGY